MTVLVLSVAVALSISFLCSLLEAAVLSLTPSQVGELARRRPRSGALWQQFKARIERPIAVILILNTAAHTIGATIAGASFEELYGHVRRIAAEGLSILIVEQFAHEILGIADRAGIMLHGRLQHVGAPAHIANELADAYLGADHH